MVREDRIAAWGIGATVDRIFEGGVKSHKDIARQMNADPEVQKATSNQQVLRKDVENYLRQRAQKVEERRTKALAYAPGGAELIQQARENVGWLIEQVEVFKPLSKRLTSLFEKALDRYEVHLDDGTRFDKNGNDTAPFPKEEIAAVDKLLRLFRDIVNDTKGDERITQLLRAQNVNVNQGMTQDEFHDALFGAFRNAEWSCHNCGTTGKMRDEDALSGFSKYQRQKRTGSTDIIDA